LPDPNLHELFRIFHFNSTSGYIEGFSTSGAVISSFALPSVDPTGTLTSAMGAIGLAYDSLRNQLDISFCNHGCGAIGGVVEAFNPINMAYDDTLFTSTSSYFGGLGYETATDTLWIGGDDAGGFYVAHVQRDGTVEAQRSWPM
jgi:hypothetical protein